MPEHKYKVGQKVRLYPRSYGLHREADARTPSAEMFEIVRLMPPTGFDPQYRLRASVKGQERIVAESEIA